jgi:hypothetical protein
VETAIKLSSYVRDEFVSKSARITIAPPVMPLRFCFPNHLNTRDKLA